MKCKWKENLDCLGMRWRVPGIQGKECSVFIWMEDPRGWVAMVFVSEVRVFNNIFMWTFLKGQNLREKINPSFFRLSRLSLFLGRNYLLKAEVGTETNPSHLLSNSFKGWIKGQRKRDMTSTLIFLTFLCTILWMAFCSLVIKFRIQFPSFCASPPSTTPLVDSKPVLIISFTLSQLSLNNFSSLAVA